jgi:hypothetical protein
MFASIVVSLCNVMQAEANALVAEYAKAQYAKAKADEDALKSGGE